VDDGIVLTGSREELRAQLAAIVEASSDAILTKTPAGIITSWNRAAEQLYGYSAHEAIGQPVTLIIPPEQPDEFPAIMARLKRGEPVEPYETVRRHKDGCLIDVSVTVSPMFAADGTVTGASAIARDIGERKRLDRELAASYAQLAESETRFRAIVETAYEGIWLIDLTAQTRLANGRMAEILGTTVEDLERRLVLDFCYHEDLPLAQERIAANIAGKVEQFDFRFRRADGTPVLVLACTSPVYDGDGAITGALGIFSDVTARRQAAAAVGETRERLQLAAQVAQFGVYDDQGAGRVYWSPELKELFGLDIEEEPVAGVETALARIHPDDRAGWLRALAAARDPSGTGEMRMEHRIVRPDGSTVWVAQQGRILFADRDGVRRGVRAIGIVQDVTARKQAEQEREQLEQLLDLSYDAIFVRTPAATITAWNQGAERLYGYTAEEARGRTSHELLATVFPPLPAAIDTLLQQQGQWEGELVHTRKDGRRVVVESRQVLLKTADGTPQAVLETNRDVTSRKQLEAEREAFMAALTHDLKSPLTTAQGTAELFQRRARRLGGIEPGELTEGLERIRSAAGRAVAMLDELLDLSRLHRGEPLTLELARCDLVALAAEAVASQQRLATHHQIELETKETELLGRWDRQRLERVLQNLLSNAIKYSPAGGPVTVRVELDQAGGRAVLAVADRGVGIPAAELPRLFAAFRRGSNVSNEIRGSGIGLMSVKQLVEAHGGTVEVTSREGQGTTVTVRLPLSP
jgi:PAS domain S-box-containing protein